MLINLHIKKTAMKTMVSREFGKQIYAFAYETNYRNKLSKTKAKTVGPTTNWENSIKMGASDSS